MNINEMINKMTHDEIEAMHKEATIARLEEIKERYIHGGDEYFDKIRREAIDQAIEAVKNQGKPRWIPTSEAMPKNSRDDNIIIHVRSAGFLVTNYYDGFNRLPHCSKYEIKANEVDAWMYIPEYEPPKSRQTAEEYLEEVGREIGASSAAFINRMTGKEEA